MKLPLTPAEKLHFESLERWRKAMDLVGPGPLEPHFEDAALAVAWLGELAQPGGLWADLGSGAGFPGVALAARYPALRVKLVESRQKRVAFLRQVAPPNAEVVEARVESLEAGSLDGVLSRAFAPPLDYLAHARRLLREGGVALLLVAAEAPPQAPGFELFHVEHYSIEGRPRAVGAYRKTG